MYARVRTLLTLLVLTAGTARAQTITVTTPMDESDVPSTATLADLPGPDGVVSFREALLVSDNTPGHQTVGFEIPEADWYLPTIYPGLVLIQASLSFSCSEPVTIDGTTQTNFTGDTFADGNEVVLGLQSYINGDGSVVTGLHASRVELEGANSLVHGNTGGMDIRLYFGGGSLIRDNEADTISLHWSSDNVIVSNTTQRIRMSAGGSLGFTARNRVGGPNLEDRNFITGWGNYGEHGSPAGDTIELYSTSDTLIENNYIGTTPDGMAIGNAASTVGIAVMTQNDNLTIRNNLIAIHATHALGGGDYGTGIYISQFEGGHGVNIVGNTIGLNALGEPLLGALHGIWINTDAYEMAQNVRIGGAGSGEGNIIAGHASTGVLMEGSPGIVPADSVRVSGNSIYANGEIGIDLTPNTWTFGPTPNDPMDADAGANGIQNFPVITNATLQGASLHVVGTLNSLASRLYRIEFFASPACDASGFGQGQVFLGSTTASTDTAGNASLEESLSVTVPAGWVLTSTAILEPSGATSEFSACTQIESDPGPGFSVCFGDGSGSPCPCGNESSLPGRGCGTSAGEGMYLSGTGTPSITADDLVMTAHDVPTGNTGLFYTGQTGLAGNALFDGLQCAGGSTMRFRGRTSSTSLVSDSGFVAQDEFGLFWTPGATYTFQYFSRDIQGSPCGGFANLSSAYAVTMTP